MTASFRLLPSLLLAGSLALATGTPAVAEHDHQNAQERTPAKQCPMKMRHRPGMAGLHGFDHLPPFLHGLDLSEEQRDRIFDITYAQIPERRKQQRELHKLKAQLRELPLSADYDAGKVKKLVDSETRLRAEQQLKMADVHHRIYQVLTEAQRKQLAERQTETSDKN